MIKKFAATALAMVLVLGGLSACAPKSKNVSNESAATDKLTVVTTIFPPYDFAKEIGGDKVDVHMLVKPGAEIHSYEPTPAEIKLIGSASLFIYNGGENDTWVDNIISPMDRGPQKMIKMMGLVNTLDEEFVEGMEHVHHHDDETEGHEHSHEGEAEEHEHSHEGEAEEHEHSHEGDAEEHEHSHEGEAEEHEHSHEGEAEEHEHSHEGEAEEHEHSQEGETEEHEHSHEDEMTEHTHTHEGEPDEHVWTSPKNAIAIATKIKEALQELDPANTDYYEENAKSYIEKLTQLDKEFEKVISGSKSKTLIVADRFPFRYLTDAYGLDYYAAFSGCSTDTEANPATMAFLINKVKELGIKTVFTIEMSDGKLASAVTDATGAQRAVLHSAHNLSQEEVNAGKTYLGLMQENLEILKKALNE